MALLSLQLVEQHLTSTTRKTRCSSLERKKAKFTSVPSPTRARSSRPTRRTTWRSTGSRGTATIRVSSSRAARTGASKSGIGQLPQSKHVHLCIYIAPRYKPLEFTVQFSCCFSSLLSFRMRLHLNLIYFN